MRGIQFWLLGLIIFLYPLSVSAQTAAAQNQQGLTMRGIIKSLTIEADKSAHYIRVELRCEVTNTGSNPIIFWKHSEKDNLGGFWDKPFVLIGKMLSRAPNFNPENVIDDQIWGPSVYISPAWAKMRKALDQQAPSPDVTTILLPNQKTEFDLAVYITGNEKRGDSFPEHPTFNELKEISTLWMRVSYEAWSFNLEPNPRHYGNMKFGHNLQKRWAKYGKLWLDNIYSEPIQLDLNTAQYKTSN